MRPVPVSTIDGAWLADTFLPMLERQLHADNGNGLVMFSVDSLEESDYLLECLRRHVQESLGLGWLEVQVDGHDPLSLWLSIAGDADQPSVLPSQAGKVVGFRRGCLLHSQAIAKRLAEWTALARGYGVLFVVPQFRQDLAPFIGTPGFPSVLQVPAFGDSPIITRRALAAALLEEACPHLLPEQRHQLASDLIDAGPTSRTELQKWIDHLASLAPDMAVGVVLPPKGLARVRSSALTIPSKQDLAVALSATLQKIRHADELFLDWQGVRLFGNIHPPHDAFQGSSPIGWFVATVSVLSCYLFDSADSRMEVLSRYRDSRTGGIVASASGPSASFLVDCELSARHCSTDCPWVIQALN